MDETLKKETENEDEKLEVVPGVEGRLGQSGSALLLYISLGATSHLDTLEGFCYACLHGPWPGLLAQIDPSLMYPMLDALDDADIYILGDDEDDVDDFEETPN